MKSYQIITYGCQANRSDSERVASLFESFGLIRDDTNPDIVIINLCSIRQSAIDRAFSMAKEIKRNEKVLILTGCFIESDRAKMKELSDYLLKIKELTKWPEIIGIGKNLDIDEYFKIAPKAEAVFSSYIPIMSGCNNFCSYCVVPYTRGREYSRPSNEIVKEAKDAIDRGAKEIWLIGQNVSSYNNSGIRLSDLIKKIESFPGEFWISFLSSHPKDIDEELLRTLRDSSKASHYINLPIQSGDDSILKRMNRPYSVSDYLKSIELIKSFLPGATLSTDIIVGFPGEDEIAFENSAKIMREIGFDMAYISRYSPRKGTASFKMTDNLSPKEKLRRQRVLTDILKETALEKNRWIIGETLPVLAQREANGYLIGKTKNYKTVKFAGSKELIGSFIEVKIKDGFSWGMKGEIR